MTETKQCLPECRWITELDGLTRYVHAPNCPNVEPAPAPKMEQREERCDGPLGCMRTVPDGHLDGCLFKPASTLAPEDDPNETCHANTQAGSPPPLKTLAPAEAPKAECEHPLSAIRNLPVRHCVLCGKPAPAPASVTPASDSDVSEWKRWGGEFARLCARIEQEKAANAELRAELEYLRTSIGVRYKPNSMCAVGHQQILFQDAEYGNCPLCAARARLAEVRAATRRVNMAAFDLYSDILPAVKALEAILAKGDSHDR